ncbi:ubiquitin carboxyl-terminal hydrolase [Shewanella sp. 202IG2-18]|uniref:ubiquitin carboxyl-terminal hydrolase n=1 Tax=Parashewanella hymeniacidonis TaxID=2807618 RepID=UPI0019616B6F|nr:ubiquitin carboxyl-terminal hydrolase family protein [Parashewanella hymeniacidonis]MBM7071072.1 ubiquitin carboxyl-terminal hydrolase [Parashewanella hymeniacidonis]
MSSKSIRIDGSHRSPTHASDPVPQGLDEQSCVLNSDETIKKSRTATQLSHTHQKESDATQLSPTHQKESDSRTKVNAWYGSQSSASLKECFIALKIQAEMFSSSEDITEHFDKIIESDSIDELEAPIHSLSTIFKGMLQFKIKKQEDGFQVGFSFETASETLAHFEFSHLKSGSFLPNEYLSELVVDDLKPSNKPDDSSTGTGIIIDGFQAQLKTNATNTLSVPTKHYRKFDSHESELFSLLKLSKLVADKDEYFECFPESPFQNLLEKDRKEAAERAQSYKSGNMTFSRTSKVTSLRRQASELTNCLIGKLQLFKAIQVYEPCLTNADFNYVLEDNFTHFDSINNIYTDDISEELCITTKFEDGTSFDESISTKAIAKSSLGIIASRQNRIPSASLPIKLQECEGVEPAGIGLHNWTNSCFMNAAFQMMATTLDQSDTLTKVRSPHTVPSISLEILLEKAIESIPINFEAPSLTFQIGEHLFSVTTDLSRSEIITTIAIELSKIPIEEINSQEFIYKAPSEDKPIHLEVSKWLAFNEATCNLISHINDNQHKTQIPVQLQVNFLDAYYELAKHLYRYTSLTLLFPQANLTNLMLDLPTELKYATIDQHDPQEFISDVFDLMGILKQEERFLNTSEYYHVVNKASEQKLSKHECNTMSASHFISIDNKSTSPSLETIIQQFVTEEELSYSDAKILNPIKALAARSECLYLNDVPYIKLPQALSELSEEELNKAIFSLPKEQFERTLEVTFDQYRVRKQVNLVSNTQQIPQRLLIQLKLFARTADGDTIKPTSTFTLNDEETSGDLGQHCLVELIRNKGIVHVPVHLDGDETPTHIKYRVDSIVCHTGSSVKSGHYTTLKFDADGNATFFNDDIAVTYSDYQKVVGDDSNISLDAFIEQQGLSGYLFSLIKVDEQDDVPRET